MSLRMLYVDSLLLCRLFCRILSLMWFSSMIFYRRRRIILLLFLSAHVSIGVGDNLSATLRCHLGSAHIPGFHLCIPWFDVLLCISHTAWATCTFLAVVALYNLALWGIFLWIQCSMMTPSMYSSASSERSMWKNNGLCSCRSVWHVSFSLLS